jgi:nitrite reductase/ring-hydroxylating ferredoxin subunit
VRHKLIRADELQPGSLQSVAVGGQQIVVIRTDDGELFALRDLCPHRGARLSHGYVGSMMGAATIGEYKLESTLVLRCPWHGYEFDLASGRCPADPRRRVRSYKVEVEEGFLTIDD